MNPAGPASSPSSTEADLGILFIHGIGQQAKAETLVNWLDPLGRWIAASLLGAQPPKFEIPEPPLWHVETAVLSSTESGVPPHAEVRMRDPRHGTSSRLLVAEAYWAECFPPPTMDEVTEWLLEYAPNTLLLHYGLNVRRAWAMLRRDGVLRAGWRLVRAVTMLVAGCFVILPVLLAALFLLLLVRLLPIPVLPEAILKQAQVALAAVIGDSMVYCASPARLAAIVRETRAAMDWLAPRCRRMAIVAHSQGAAVLRYAISGEDESANPPPANLCGVVTLGAGLRKLGILLRIQSMSGTGDRGDNLLHSFNPLMTRGLVLMALLGLAFHAAGIVWISWTMLAVFGVQAGVNNLLYALLNFEETSPAEQWWRGVLSKSSSDTEWLDLYASHDPVSNGAIWDEGAVTNATTLEIRNGGSFARDHTAYWRNKADFLSRVAGFLSRTGKLDVRLHELVDGDSERIERECAQRRWRHAFVRCCWLLIAAAIAWVAVAHQDSIAVRCVGEQVRGQLSWLHSASAKTIAWGVLAALLLLWTFACRWLRDVWDDAAAASLAGHKSFAVDLNVGLAWVLVVATLLFYFMLASQFGLPMA